MSDEKMQYALAMERISILREDIKEINQRLDKFASGMLGKMKGDTELALRLQRNTELVHELDGFLVRGLQGSTPIKAEVENLRREVNQVFAILGKLEATLAEFKHDSASVAVAKITASSSNWKTTAVIISTALTAIASLVLALLK